MNWRSAPVTVVVVAGCLVLVSACTSSEEEYGWDTGTVADADARNESDGGDSDVEAYDSCFLRTQHEASRYTTSRGTTSTSRTLYDKQGRLRRRETLGPGISVVEVRAYRQGRRVAEVSALYRSAMDDEPHTVEETTYAYENGRRVRAETDGLLSPRAQGYELDDDLDRIVVWSWENGEKVERTVDGVPDDYSLRWHDSRRFEPPDGQPEYVETWSYSDSARVGEIRYSGELVERVRREYDQRGRLIGAKRDGGFRRMLTETYYPYNEDLMVPFADGKWDRVVDWSIDEESGKRVGTVDKTLVDWRETDDRIERVERQRPDGRIDVRVEQEFDARGRLLEVRRDGNIHGLLTAPKEGTGGGNPGGRQPVERPDGHWDSLRRSRYREMACPEQWPEEVSELRPIERCPSYADWCVETTSCDQRIGAIDQVVGGWRHTCALDEQGRAYCWGENSFGQLGSGTRRVRRTPVAVETDHRFTDLAAGQEHTCGLTDDGAVYCWGRNREGQLGDGSRRGRTTPTRVAAETSFFEFDAGRFHTCALAGTPGTTSEGPAYCWGANHYGQLGNETLESQTTPAKVAGSKNYGRLQLAVVRSCAAGSTLDCWGAAESQLTLAPAHPFADKKMDTGLVDVVDAPETIFASEPSAIAAGRAVTCQATASNVVECKHLDAPDSEARTEVDGDLTDLAISGGRICGVTDDGELWCDLSGKLRYGPPSGTEEEWNVELEQISGRGYADVTFGGRHQCVVSEGGRVFCAGLNIRGAAGLGSRGIYQEWTPVTCQR